MAAKRRREDLEREVESVKREWEEKNKNKNKDKDKTKDKDKDKDKKDVEPTLAAAGEKPVAPIVTVVGEGGGEGGTTSTTTVEADIPRIYTLHRNIFQMRVNRLRTAEMAKRNRERLGNPTNFFPSVPSGEL